VQSASRIDIDEIANANGGNSKFGAAICAGHSRRDSRTRAGCVLESENMSINHGDSLDRLLESAVVASWADLVRGVPTELVHVEYDFTGSGALEYLQVWSSIVRGHWLMVCGYQMAGSELHDSGVQFHNGYQSEDLARSLELAILHQKAFTLPRNFGRAGLLQIATPTRTDSEAAAVSVNETFDRINCGPAEPIRA
jgi:hypothetical protein